jgi:pimeloyl-ACP methyl ester carboxylesterase
MTWILLRGLTREARHWGAFPAAFKAQLAAYAPDEQVVVLDLPGNGEFAGQTSPLTAGGMVAFVRQQLLARALSPPYKLLAMSLGGMVTTSWAQDHPDEIARMVLINTSMRPHGSPVQRLRPGNWFTLALLAARWQDFEYAEQVIHQLTCRRLGTPGADVAAWVQVRKSAPVSERNAQRQLWAAARFACSPATPACPVLVLSSRADQLVHPRCSTRLASAWGALHEQHPWAGHDLPHDDGQWVLERVLAWIYG